MAGKTITGMGKFEDGAPPVRGGDAPESEGAPFDETEDIRGVYSGPTVVDDDKVAEGLKRLRAIEQPSVTVAGEVSDLVADMDSAEPTKIGPSIDQRSTAVGRGLAAEPAEHQLVVHADSLRGTMFGHSVHLPDVRQPASEEPESGSGPTYVPPRQPAPTLIVPYQHRPLPQLGNADPFTLEPPPATFPNNEPEVRTETIPPEAGKRLLARAAATVVGLAAIASAILAVIYYRYADGGPTLPPPAPEPAPVIGQAQVSPTTPTTPPAAGSAAAVPGQTPGAGAAPDPQAPGGPAGTTAAADPLAADPSAALAGRNSAGDPPLGDTPPRKRVPADRLSSGLGADASPSGDASRIRLRQPPSHGDRRHGDDSASTTAGKAGSTPAKPAGKKRGSEDDPDATLPMSPE